MKHPSISDKVTTSACVEAIAPAISSTWAWIHVHCEAKVHSMGSQLHTFASIALRRGVLASFSPSNNHSVLYVATVSVFRACGPLNASPLPEAHSILVCSGGMRVIHMDTAAVRTMTAMPTSGRIDTISRSFTNKARGLFQPERPFVRSSRFWRLSRFACTHLRTYIALTIVFPCVGWSCRLATAFSVAFVLEFSSARHSLCVAVILH
jgi:hypothetical protein